MNVQSFQRDKDEWLTFMEEVTAEQAFLMLDDPVPAGPTTHVHFFIKKSVAEGRPEAQILHRLTAGFERHSLFRKEQSFFGACLIYLQTEDLEVMTAAKAFIDRYKDALLPLLNQVECTLLRLTRKANVLQVYPNLREEISHAMQSVPELIRFVNAPSAFSLTYGEEVQQHHVTFEKLKQLSDTQLQQLLDQLLPVEAAMDEEFWKARKKLADSELQLLGFEIYGKDGRHYFFRGVLHNYGIERRPDIVAPSGFKETKPKLLQLDSRAGL